MRDLLEYLITSLASKPESIVINERTEEGTVIFELSVDSEDMGFIIGKSGQTIRAIRRLLVARAIAENQGLKVHLNLQDSPKV